MDTYISDQGFFISPRDSLISFIIFFQDEMMRNIEETMS